MPKKKPIIKVKSYGRYSSWKRNSRELPKVLEFTNTIKSEEGNEFGMILHISGGKGTRLEYCIKHPPFKDNQGNTEPDFTGEYYIKSNNYTFFIGDCIWLPLEDKVGKWTVSVHYNGKVVASQEFKVVL